MALLGLALDSADPNTAAKLHGAADLAREQLGSSRDPLEAQLREADHDRLKSEPGEAIFQTAWEAGHRYGLRAASTMALETVPQQREHEPLRGSHRGLASA